MGVQVWRIHVSRDSSSQLRRSPAPVAGRAPPPPGHAVANCDLRLSQPPSGDETVARPPSQPSGPRITTRGRPGVWGALRVRPPPRPLGTERRAERPKLAAQPVVPRTTTRPFLACIEGESRGQPATMQRVSSVPVFLSVEGRPERPEPSLMPRGTPLGRRRLRPISPEV